MKFERSKMLSLERQTYPVGTSNKNNSRTKLFWKSYSELVIAFSQSKNKLLLTDKRQKSYILFSDIK